MMKKNRSALSPWLILFAFAVPVSGPAQTPAPARPAAKKEPASGLVSSAYGLLESAIKSRASSTAAVIVQNFKRALDEANKAIAAEPASAPARLIRARIYIEMPAEDAGKPANRELALKDCDQAVTLRPADAAPYYWRGAIRLQIAASLRNTNAMMAGFLSGAGVKEDVKITDSRGASLPQILDLALADLNKAVLLEPIPGYYLARGNAYKAKENYDAARRDYAQALKLDPEFQAARAALTDLPSAAALVSGEWDFTNTLGTSPIKFRLQFSGAAGVLAGSVVAANGNKTPLQSVVLKPDRSVSFKLVTGNGATLDCTGAFTENFKKMSGQSTVTFNGQSGKGQFSADKRP